MRSLLLLVCILSFSTIFAQGGGGGGGQREGGQQRGGQNNQQQQQRPEIRAFKASEMAGIFNYNANEVINKIKLKTNKELKLKVCRALVTYNNKVNDIALLNKDNFDTLNVFVNTAMKANRPSRGQGNQMGGSQQQGGRESMRNDSENPMRKAMTLARAKIQPAKAEVKQAEVELNKDLEVLLNEKQYKKWKAYQKKIKDDLKPKQASNNNSNSGTSRGGRGQDGRQGGGMR